MYSKKVLSKFLTIPTIQSSFRTLQTTSTSKTSTFERFWSHPNLLCTKLFGTDEIKKLNKQLSSHSNTKKINRKNKNNNNIKTS